MEKIKDLLNSSKFWAFLLALAVVGFKAAFPDNLSNELVYSMVVACVGWMIGRGLQNVGDAKSGGVNKEELIEDILSRFVVKFFSNETDPESEEPKPEGTDEK